MSLMSWNLYIIIRHPTSSAPVGRPEREDVMFMMPTIDMVATGKNIERLRKIAGLSVRDLQDVFGFATPQAIYKWQHWTAMPTIDNLVVLAALLQVKIDDILVVDATIQVQISAWRKNKADSLRWVRIWSPGLKVRTQPFQGCNARFKSGGDHCGYSTTVSAADCGSAYPGSTPGSHPMGR